LPQPLGVVPYIYIYISPSTCSQHLGSCVLAFVNHTVGTMSAVVTSRHQVQVLQTYAEAGLLGHFLATLHAVFHNGCTIYILPIV
jgi:hypothetical protein